MGCVTGEWVGVGCCLWRMKRNRLTNDAACPAPCDIFCVEFSRSPLLIDQL